MYSMLMSIMLFTLFVYNIQVALRMNPCHPPVTLCLLPQPPVHIHQKKVGVAVLILEQISKQGNYPE